MSNDPSEILCDGQEISVSEEWSNTSFCCASTSKRKSHSSGDIKEREYICYDDNCSCGSDRDYVSFCEKPFRIADSSTNLHKSKWHMFKRFFRLGNKRKVCRKKQRNDVKGDVKKIEENVKETRQDLVEVKREEASARY